MSENKSSKSREVTELLLCSKGTILGTVYHDGDGDMPWFYGRFTPADAYKDFAEIFGREASLVIEPHSPIRDAEHSKVIREIVALELELLKKDTGVVLGKPDLLYIRGEKILWRGRKGILRQ